MAKADITVGLVSGLVADQFPQWAHLPVRPVALDGWDNTTFRLGDTMSVRVPSADAYALQVDKEQRWLPVLAPQLPLAIPFPLGRGQPSAALSRPWSVYRWIEGEPLLGDSVVDPVALAEDVAGFLAALYTCTPAGPCPARTRSTVAARSMCGRVHGDITGTDLVVRDGRLAGVVDFGCSAYGDPACDLTIAWTYLDRPARDRFMACVPVEPSAWARARG